MLKINFYLIVFTLIVAHQSLDAQTYSTGREIKKDDGNFMEIANYYKAHPLPVVRKQLLDEDEHEEHPRRHKAAPSQVHMINRNTAGRISSTGPMPASPAPNDTFLSTVSDGSSIPPDTHGAVDSAYCVTAVNTNFHIQTRTGVNVSDVSIDGFWTSILPSGDDGYDPRVHFDPFYNRWIYVTDAINLSTKEDSYIMIAVSATNSPTGVWHRYLVSIDATNATWLDFPCVGFNHKWVTVSGNIFTTAGHAQGAVLYVFNYDSLMAGTGAPFTKIVESSSFTLCPALTYDSTEQSMFLAEINSASSGKLQLWKLTGPVSSPVISSVGYPATTTHWQNGGSNDFAPQLGTTDKVQADDDRITNLTYRNHALWCAHTIFLPATGTANRCSIMWWQIDTLANPLQNGIIDDPTTPTFFDFPSITANANNDALVGFGYLSANIHPSAGYAVHLHTDPSDSMRLPYVFRHGQATYYQTFSGTQNRWGDFSATCVDPKNNLDFWTIQESVPASPADYWDTWWAYVSVCPVSSSFTLTHDTINKNLNDTITFTGIAPTGTVYTWNFDGGTATPGTGAGPQVVKWTTYGWKVVTLKDSLDGCAVTYSDSVWVVNLEGVNQLTSGNRSVNIVPNPSNGNFVIQFTTPVNAASVSLVDEKGNIVFDRTFETISDNKISLSTQYLPSGIYIANIYVGDNTIRQKIEITK